MQARAKWGRSDIAPPWTGSPASTKGRRRAPEVVGRAVAAVAAETVGNRNLRRTRYFRPRGTSSPTESYHRGICRKRKMLSKVHS